MPAVVDRYLLPREEVAFQVRRHWMAIAEYVLYYAAFLLGGFIVLGLGSDHEFMRFFAAAFIFFSTCWFGWFYLDWQFERLVATRKRVLLITGIVNRSVAIMPMAKVTDLTYTQSWLGRILDYGTFKVESAGQDQALSRITFISDPDLRYQQVSRVLFGDDAPVDEEDNMLPLDSEPDSEPDPLPEPSDPHAHHTAPLPRV